MTVELCVTQVSVVLVAQRLGALGLESIALHAML